MNESRPLELLKQARTRFTQREIAERVGKNAKTVGRWEKGETPCPTMLEPALRDMLQTQPTCSARGDQTFRFVDLFAGIGGIRLAFEGIRGECVFTSEWDSYAQRTYMANFGGQHPIHGDITQINAADIPDHDVLLGGFPCQPFSIAGVSKKNALGRAHGFADETQGTLFFDVARIIAAKRPKAFMLKTSKTSSPMTKAARLKSSCAPCATSWATRFFTK